MAGSAIEGYLEDLFGELARLEEAGRRLHPRAGQGRPRHLVGLSLATLDGASTPPATSIARSRSSPSPSRSCTRWRWPTSGAETVLSHDRGRAHRRRRSTRSASTSVSDRPVQPDGERRGDRHGEPRGRADPRRQLDRIRRRRSLGLRGPRRWTSTRTSTPRSATPATATARSPTSCAPRPARRRRRLTLDVYFRQCSMLVTCSDLAVMAARWRAAACNPVTGGARARRRQRRTRAERHEHLRDVRLRRRVGLHGRAAGEERGVGRRRSPCSRAQLGDRGVHPAAGQRGNSVRGMAAVPPDLTTTSSCTRTDATPVRICDAAFVRRGRASAPCVCDLPRTSARSTPKATASPCSSSRATCEFGVDRAGAPRRCSRPRARCDFVVLDVRRVGTVDAPALRILRGMAGELERVGRARSSSPTLSPSTDARFVARCCRRHGSSAASRRPTMRSKWCEDALLGGDADGRDAAGARGPAAAEGVDPADARGDRGRGRPTATRSTSANHGAARRRARGRGLLRALGCGQRADLPAATTEAVRGGSAVVRRRASRSGRRRCSTSAFGPPTCVSSRRRRSRRCLTRRRWTRSPASPPRPLRARCYRNLAQMLAARLRAANGQLRALDRLTQPCSSMTSRL